MKYECGASKDCSLRGWFCSQFILHTSLLPLEIRRRQVHPPDRDNANWPQLLQLFPEARDVADHDDHGAVRIETGARGIPNVLGAEVSYALREAAPVVKGQTVDQEVQDLRRDSLRRLEFEGHVAVQVAPRGVEFPVRNRMVAQALHLLEHQLNALQGFEGAGRRLGLPAPRRLVTDEVARRSVGQPMLAAQRLKEAIGGGPAQNPVGHG